MSDKYLKYMDDVKKFASNVNEAAVKTIVGYLGIALQSRDASLVSCTDPKELDRVVDGFCKKKLGLSAADAAATVQGVCEDMKADRQKNRVTFYYLTAEKSGTLSKLA